MRRDVGLTVFDRLLSFDFLTQPSAISSSEVGAQRSLSDFFSALTASSTILLIASARDGTSIWPRRQSSTIRKKESDTRI
jgi:hypothetical protein